MTLACTLNLTFAAKPEIASYAASLLPSYSYVSYPVLSQIIQVSKEGPNQPKYLAASPSSAEAIGFIEIYDLARQFFDPQKH